MSEITVDILQNESSTVKAVQNPFPGLRPFGIDESHLFFGREGQSDEVLVKLSRNKFVAVIGASGSGKSSFMFCGVIPILYGGFLTRAGSNWTVVVARPGGGPIENLSEALLNSNPEYLIADEEEKRIKKTITSTLLKGSSLGLVEAVSQLRSSQGQNILLLVDQFEELFRFKKSEEGTGAGANESLAFVNLLLEAVASNQPIYVALTMRSDFIGECAQFPELTKLINDSHYLIPQMTREQKRNAIVGPVAVGGASVSQRLVQQLLNDLGDNPDQLPILQHALMRTWTYWRNNHQEGEVVDLHHYEAIGGMKEALSQHANEAYEELTPRQKEICEYMFKALTEKGGESSGIRRPTRLGVIAAIANATEDEVKQVVERFRQPGRSLLTPPAGIPLTSSSVIDISHESLMRIWVRLKVWVEEEAEAVEMYQRLSEAAAMYQQGKTGLWRPPDLQLALNWREKHKPTLVWAQRYNPAFERTMVFVETSKQAFETEQKIKEMLQRRMLKRTRIVAVVLGIAAIISIGFLIYAVIQKTEADRNFQEAEKQRQLAVANEAEAKKQQKIAEQQQKIAEHEREIAEEQKKIAEEQKALAEKNAEEARRQTIIAKENEKEALRQKAIALENEKEAKKQKELADQNADKAYRLRLLSIAQSMAVKSLQIEDTMSRGAIAMQAYRFHNENGGNKHNHDIYDGLYYALKMLKPADYNSLKGHHNAVRGMAFSSSGNTLFTCGSDGRIIRWDLQNHNMNEIWKNNYVNRVISVSPDEKWLACGGDKAGIQLFNLDSIGTKPKVLSGHKGNIASVIFTENGLISAGTGDSSVFRWNVKEGTHIVVYKAHAKIKSLALSPDGKKMAIGTDNGKVILVEDGNESIIAEKKGRIFHSVTFGKNGQWLAAGDDIGTIRIWNTSEKKQIGTLKGQKARINDIQFSKDARYLATASFDASARLYNMENLNEQPLELKDHDSWAWSLAFSPDGNKLMVGCVDKLIRIWPTGIEFMANEICDKLQRNMTGMEWQRYVAPVSDIPYQKTCAHLESKEAIKEENEE
jgi:WD40 repeat protein/energy-coupling factor transporter ATP-binding protein EcfA2